MRILAIRGRNLASLAQEFEVDFRLEPLASAGLFAITGPTGAGKSTLLDALCLALYDDTPRLLRATAKGINLPDVREETIAPGDPRSLLRRGAAEGFAEVDFAGNDGLAYRARWSVRRARNKPDGKLQPSEMALSRIADGQPVAGSLKTEVLAEIQRRIGLSFPQFTRAVLLAQNEFATFLKASDDERAELLQTLTGTDLFTDISRRAFERNKAEREQLDQQRQRLADQQPLEPETRARLEKERDEGRGAVQQQEKRRAELEGQLRWHQAWEQATQAEAAAQAALDKAQADEAAALARRQRFARSEAVQPARPLLAESQRLGRELAEGRQALGQAEAQVARGGQARQAAEAELKAAGERLQQAEEARAAAVPDLERAKELDAQLRLLAPARAEALKRLEAAKAKAEQSDKERQARQDEGQRVELARQEAVQWLAGHAGLQLLAEGWSRWQGLLGQGAAILAEQAGNDKELAALAKAEADRLQALAAATGQLESAGRQCAGFDAEALANRKRALEQRRDALLAGERIWQELAGRQARLGQLEAKAADLAKAMAQAGQALADARSRKPALEQAAAQAAQSLRLAEAACHAGVEELRAGLEPETPCPVCGAVEHPYAGPDSRLREVLLALRGEAERCRRELEGQVRQETAQDLALAAGRRQEAEIQPEKAALAAELARDRQRWQAHPLFQEMADLAGDGQPDWFAAQLGGLKAQLEAIGQEEAGQRQALRQQEQARQAQDKARQAQAEAKDAATAAQLAHQQAAQSRQAAAERGADLARRLDDLLAAADAAFPGQDWRAAWRSGPAAFLAARQAEVEAWHARQKQRQDMEARAAAIAAELKGLAQTCSAAAEALQAARQGFAAVDRDLADKQARRRQLFDGRPLADVEEALDKAIVGQKQLQQQRQLALQQAATEEGRGQEACRQLGAQQAGRQARLEAANAELAAWLADFNRPLPPASALAMDELTALLAFDAAWLAAERQDLQALATAVETARAVLGERRLARQAREQERPGADSADAVRTALAAAVQALESAKAQVTARDIELGKDDERRARSAALLQAIEAQEAKARVWGQLNELIGSADGRKFRNFAQQLTLDVLLGYANRHLESLSRRYRLERVKDTLALLVVDQDMGGEIRSVHSLSGGESFLLSLALALGLASLSSHQVRVESLFIDEGFGSLDAEALRVAMEALDSLQAQGRKVGVISHVQEMTERIGTQIQVRRLAGGQSRLAVSG